MFTTEMIEGKTLWNGGGFGMQRSLICTMVYVVGSIFLFVKKTRMVNAYVQKESRKKENI